MLSPTSVLPGMVYRRFGRTGLSMPVLSCGGMRYQFKWNDVPESEIPPENQANLEATILRALEVGITHIETARGYGSSEMQLGKILPRLPRDRMIIQTKIPPTATQAEFFATFETSMKYLGLNHVDLLSLHGINNRLFLDHSLKRGGSVDAARELQRQGRVRHVGFSTHATTDLILEAVQSDRFDYLNLHWYFVNELNWPAIREAEAREMGVFIISPNDKGGKLYEPPPKLVELCRPLSPMQFNALFCLSRDSVHTLSCGAARPADFDEHLRGLAFLERQEELLPVIESRLRAEMVRTLGKEWCSGWMQGIPQYLEIPGEVNVLEILRLWTYAKAFDLVAWAKMRYNLLGQGDHWFPGENSGRLGGLNLALALEKSPFADRIPVILKEAHEWFFEGPRKRLSQS